MRTSDTDDEIKTAHRYFGSFADDYHRAFKGSGANPLHHLINRLFRRKTFTLRTQLVSEVLQQHSVAGKTVLDLGCGSGEVSLIAAAQGATVIGLDIVDDMVTLARAEAAAARLQDRTTFRVADILRDELPPSDVTMMVGVIEYYSDLDTLCARVCAATRELLVIVDTRGPFWRRTLRYLLARMKHFYVFYRSPDTVSAIVARNGFKERRRVLGHSFTMLAFERSPVG
jgi:2-polyprenyl-3-methyl-5-hydroxy-6-metoxy-1,4-benzoquinol methylase